MSKDGKKIAKGQPRSRYLVDTDDVKCSKRLLTYNSKAQAESGFNNSWFYSAGGYTEDDLEAVEVEEDKNMLVTITLEDRFSVKRKELKN